MEARRSLEGGGSEEPRSQACGVGPVGRLSDELGREGRWANPSAAYTLSSGLQPSESDPGNLWYWCLRRREKRDAGSDGDLGRLPEGGRFNT